MEYEPEFARSFMRRALEGAQSYDGPYDATLLVNCLLGLLIVPKESLVEKIPANACESLSEWEQIYARFKDSDDVTMDTSTSQICGNLCVDSETQSPTFGLSQFIGEVK